MEQFDVIGDVHGQAEALNRLLRQMGYSERRGTWHHPSRMAIFVGDYIDAGPQQLAAITTVRRMVEEGAAYALMGNHEFNAICWFTADPDNPDDYLRSRFSPQWGAKNRKQHAAFLAETENHPDLHRKIIEWFYTLPLWLEFDGLRVVHACWDWQAIQTLKHQLGPSGTLRARLMPEACKMGSPLNEAVERTLKGQEVGLPEGVYFYDAYGIRRNDVRRRWWDLEAVTYRQSALLPETEANQLPNELLPIDLLFPVEWDRLTIFGHYCQATDPMLSSYFACVDTCAARGGRLTAYRWSGEAELAAENFVSVTS